MFKNSIVGHLPTIVSFWPIPMDLEVHQKHILKVSWSLIMIWLRYLYTFAFTFKSWQLHYEYHTIRYMRQKHILAHEGHEYDNKCTWLPKKSLPGARPEVWGTWCTEIDLKTLYNYEDSVSD